MNINNALTELQMNAWMQAAQTMGMPPEVAQQALISAVALEAYKDAMIGALVMNPLLQQIAWTAAQNIALAQLNVDPLLEAEMAAMRAAANSCRGRPGVMQRSGEGWSGGGGVRADWGGARGGVRGGARVPSSVPASGPRAPGAASGPAGAGAVQTIRSAPLPQGPADQKLAALQSSTVDFAQRELDRGITLAKNPERIAEYARAGGMESGHWCGYFTGFNYQQAAKAAGGEFNKDAIQKFHSMQKARAYFEYSNYTKGTNDDALRAKHESEGSTRRWMTLSGSHGEQHAKANGRPAEVYAQPSELPVRKGDTVLFSFGHVGIVKDFDPATGRLVTLEGNAGGGKVREIVRNLDDPKMRAQIEGFGRPAMGDFTVPDAAKQAA